MTASRMTAEVRRAPPPGARRSSAASAITPPSPWLSARMMTLTYLTETTRVTDQNTSEMTPYTSPAVGWTFPWSREKTVCSAYSGLVPMSPNTTPSAASISAPAGRCTAGAGRRPAAPLDSDVREVVASGTPFLLPRPPHTTRPAPCACRGHDLDPAEHDGHVGAGDDGACRDQNRRQQPNPRCQPADATRAAGDLRRRQHRWPDGRGAPSCLRPPGLITPAREPVRLILDCDGNLGQGGRVLPVVMCAEQQVLAAAEKDANVGLSAAAVAAVRTVHRRGRAGSSPGYSFPAPRVLGRRGMLDSLALTAVPPSRGGAVGYGGFQWTARRCGWKGDGTSSGIALRYTMPAAPCAVADHLNGSCRRLYTCKRQVLGRHWSPWRLLVLPVAAALEDVAVDWLRSHFGAASAAACSSP